MALTIRPHTKADEAAVIALILHCQNVEFGVPLTLADQPDLADVEGSYRRGGGEFWVATDGERVVGTLGLIDIGGGDGAIRKMFVRPEYRGPHHGTATKLLRTLEDACRSAGIGRLFLGTVEILHAAHRFYEKNGFRRIAKADLPITFPAMAVDTIFYMCDSFSSREGSRA